MVLLCLHFTIHLINDIAGKRALVGRWLSRLLLVCLFLLAGGVAAGQEAVAAATAAALPQSLTDQERAWLREHPVIRVAGDPGWPPVEFADERGGPSGMSGDYLTLIEQRLGVKFERARNLSWQEAYAKLKHWEIDMTTSVVVTPERAEFWAFTRPYMRIPIVIVTRRNVTYIGAMRELAGKKVAVVEGYAVNDWLPRDFPEIPLVRVKTTREGLEALRRGEVYAYIDSMLTVDYYLAKLDMATLKISGQTPYVNLQSMAVRKDWAILAGILDKTLDSISESERDAIYRKWLPPRYERGFDYTRLWQALALLGAVLLGMLFWIRKLSREIRRRKEAEAASGESERRFHQLFDVAAVPLCFVNKDGVIVDFNDRFTRMFGYSHADVPTLAEWWRLAYPDPAYRAWVLETWNAAVEQAARSGTDIAPIEYQVVCKDGSRRTVLISGNTLGEDFLATFFDVTERRAAEDALYRRTEELRQRNEELERFNRATVGRELDMIALKRRINALSIQLGRAPPYPLSFLDDPEPPAGDATP
ncbi:MAG: transporter substrate-binding domain-containing protein [Gallionellaceae bacterium]|nr:transporter substrate-binding domain-containing protein [Gallionellaceae bacterium]